ncbi:MAG TPA: PQQ-binding-like beta-propeller repeat protein [Candidatus Dormibacteraeota bacterium]|nr:PQQ-binding-like beta-propeller repeat protein [Candidatus Dormibacteraeota bacterium]
MRIREGILGAALSAASLLAAAAAMPVAAAAATSGQPLAAYVCSVQATPGAGVPVLGCGPAGAAGIGLRTSSFTAAPAATSPTCAVVPGVNDYCPSWTASYDNPAADSVVNQTSGDDEPHGFHIAGDRFYLAGNSFDGSSRYDMFLAAYDRFTGTQLWAQRWHDPDGDSDTAWSVTDDPNTGRVFITGQRCLGGYCFVETVAYDHAGNELWATPYHDSGGGNDLTGSIAVSPDGSRVYVAGGQQPDWTRGSSVAQFVTIAYDAATGAQQWLQTYQGPFRGDGDDLSQARSIAVDPAGNAVYVGGFASANSPGDPQIDTFTTIAYDAASGGQLWLTNYRHQNVDALQDMVLTPDGARLYLTGLDRECAGGCDVATDSYATVAYDAHAGTQVWSNVASNIGDATRIALSPDGTTVYTSGIGYAQTVDNYVAATVAVDTASGVQRWLVDTRAAGGDGWANDVTALGSPAAAVIGVVSEFGGPVYQTVALEQQTGQTLWSAMFNPNPGNDVANPWHVGATSDGWVLVAGLLAQDVDPANGATNDIDAFAFGYQVTAAPADVPELPALPLTVLPLIGVSALMAARHRRRQGTSSSQPA